MACPLSAGCGCQGYRVVWGRVLAGCGGSQGRLGPVWAAPGVLGASMLAWVAFWDLLRGWRLVLHVAQFTHTGVAWCWWPGYA